MVSNSEYQCYTYNHCQLKKTIRILFMIAKFDESFIGLLQDNNDSQLSFLYNILKRSYVDKSQENKIKQHDDSDKKIQSDSSHYSSFKSVFPNKNNISLINDKSLKQKTEATIKSHQIKHPSKKFTKSQNINISIDKKCNSSLLNQQLLCLKQQSLKKIDRTYYIFDQRNSFYPAHVPIKYGFQIRSLIKNNRLPLWRFSNQDKNQIIYNSSINQNLSNKISSPFTISSLSKKLKFSSSTTVIQKYSLSIVSHIQRHWINSLLNSRQLKEHQKQLSPTVYQSNHQPSTSTMVILRKPSLYKLVSLKKYSDKQQNHHEYKIKRRTRCITFEEHLQRYYLSKWCLIYTSDFKNK